MPEFRIRVEFDVHVDNPSHIDAAFAGAEWLKRRADADRFDYLVYGVQAHGSDEWKDVDLEEVTEPDEDGATLREYVTAMEAHPAAHAFHRDGAPCVRATTLHDCPENHRYGRTFEEAH